LRRPLRAFQGKRDWRPTAVKRAICTVWDGPQDPRGSRTAGPSDRKPGRMPSRTPSRTGRSGRSTPAPSSNATAMLFGGIAVVVVIVLFVVMSRGGDKEPANGANAAPKAAAPAAAPSTTPAPQPSGARTFAAKAGKPPARTAPALPQSLLDQSWKLYDEAKALSNEGVHARNTGDADAAAKKQSAAAVKLEEIKKATAVPWGWQEEAEMGDWALPAEYVALGRLYDDVTKLEKQVRMGGGKR
jgi:hypothetical protein